MATTETAEPVVEITEAARKLRVGYWRLRDMLLRGELVGFKRDGRWVVRTSSLEQYARRSND